MTVTVSQPSASSRLRGSWAPIDTGFLRDRRVRLLSRPAKLLQLACQLRSNESLSDGQLTKSDLRLAAAEADLDAKEEAAAVADLVRAGLLERHGLDYLITGFLGVSKAERERRQEQARVRQQNKRDRDAQRDGERDAPRDSHADVTPAPLRAEDRDRDFVERSEEEASLRPAAPDRADVEQLCQHMVDSVVSRGAKRPIITATWRTQARLLLDRDGHSLDEAIAVMDWAAEDSFWCSNVLAIPTFRAKFDQLRLKRDRSNGSRHRATLADVADAEEMHERMAPEQQLTARSATR